MKIIYPKRPTKRSFTISDQTVCIVETFAKYAGMSEDEVVDRFMKNLLCDPNFARHIRGLRRNKRTINRIFYGDIEMGLLDEYAKDVQVIPIEMEDDETETGESKENL